MISFDIEPIFLDSILLWSIPIMRHYALQHLIYLRVWIVVFVFLPTTNFKVKYNLDNYSILDDALSYKPNNELAHVTYLAPSISAWLVRPMPVMSLA